MDRVPASARPAPAPRGARVRSLADDLRARSDAQLASLLLARPDLLRPAPGDLTSLAARAVTRASLTPALDDLDTGLLQVLQAVAVLAPAGGVGPVARLLGLSPDVVAPLLEELWRRALVWRSGHARHAPRPVTEALGPYVAGLAPPSAAGGRPLAGAAGVAGSPGGSPVVPSTSSTARGGSGAAWSTDALTPAERAIVDRLTWGPPVGRPPRSGPTAQAVTALLDAGWLAPADDGEVILPREIALDLRGGRLFRVAQPEPPAWTGQELPAARVDGAAAGAALQLLGLLDELIARWGAQPPRVLRSGGLAVRDLRRTAEALDVDPATAAFVVELARDAGLVGDDGRIDPAWLPTHESDEWGRTPQAQRWAALIGAWLTSTRAPHRVGYPAGAPWPPAQDDGEPGSGRAGVVNALSDDASWPRLRVLRAQVLAELLTAPAGLSVGEDALVERMTWRHPLRPASMTREVVASTRWAAELLGVTGGGAVPAGVRALLIAEGIPGPLPAATPDSTGLPPEAVRAAPGSVTSEPERDAGPSERAPGPSEEERGAALELIAAMLPPPVDHLLLQADLTAVVPGPPGPRLADLMRAAATRESRGGASVYRFDADSLRRALDRGWGSQELLDALADASATPLPQPLTYLVNDVARRHGTARVGAAAAYVRCDDPGALDILLARTEAAPARLRRLAPTVAISPLSALALVDALRAAGGAPVLEGSDGLVLTGEAEPVRARRQPAAPVTLQAPTEQDADRLVAAMRVGQQARDLQEEAARANPDAPAVPAAEPTVVLALVREAIARRSALWIGVADSDGSTRRVLLHPSRVEGGRVYGYVDQARGAGERAVSLHRITGAVLP